MPTPIQFKAESGSLLKPIKSVHEVAHVARGPCASQRRGNSVATALHPACFCACLPLPVTWTFKHRSFVVSGTCFKFCSTLSTHKQTQCHQVTIGLSNMHFAQATWEGRTNRRLQSRRGNPSRKKKLTICKIDPVQRCCHGPSLTRNKQKQSVVRHRRLKWCPAPPCYLWIFASTRFLFRATGRETLHTVRVTSIHYFMGPGVTVDHTPS
jgi:hypothetical protein